MGQRPQLFRQRIHSRHLGSVQQDRNEPDVAAKGRSDLKGDEIIWIINPTLAAFTLRFEPARADEGQKYITIADLFAQMLDEVDPGRNMVDVHKNVLLAEFAG